MPVQRETMSAQQWQRCQCNKGNDTSTMKARCQRDEGNNPSAMLAKMPVKCWQQHRCTKDNNTSTKKQGQSCQCKDCKAASATRVAVPAKQQQRRKRNDGASEVEWHPISPFVRCHIKFNKECCKHCHQRHWHHGGRGCNGNYKLILDKVSI